MLVSMDVQVNKQDGTDTTEHWFVSLKHANRLMKSYLKREDVTSCVITLVAHPDVKHYKGE